MTETETVGALALAVVFLVGWGAGLLCGIVLTCLMRSRHTQESPPQIEQAPRIANRTRSMWD